MVDADPVPGSGDAGRTVSAPVNNLVLRVISAAVLAPVAIYAAYLGGWPFTVFWAAAAVAVLWEWISLVTGLGWIIAGIGYAGIMLLAPLLLRGDEAYGFLAVLLLFAIVWTTDVLGYFVGRAFGGPKLLPAVSPKKTWSGAIAGTLGAMIVAVMAASFFGTFNRTAIAIIALLLSVVAQLGDLLEILGQAPVRRQRCKPAHSRPWRRDGPA